ncbi:MAG: helicase [Cyanobacteria bacterium RYN_339]|nr:helicase [Cyanobacteria bacterium RYN_339]
MAFTDTDVRDWVGATVFSQAVALAPLLQDLTLGEGARDGDLLANARTGCARAYDVTLRYAGGKLSSLCSCADRRNCVHGAAVALAVRQRGASVAAEVWETQVGWQDRLAAWTAPAPAAPVSNRTRSRFVYCLRWPRGAADEPELQLRVRMASSVPGLAWHLYRTELSDPDEDRLIESVIRRIRARDLQYRDGESPTAVSWLMVQPEFVTELLTRLALHPNVEDGRRRALVIHPALALQVGMVQRQVADALELQPIITGPGGKALQGEAELLGTAGARWAACSGALMRVSPAAERAWQDRAPIRIPAAERREFERHHMPGLLEAGLLQDTRQTVEEWPQGKPRPQLLLVEADLDLVVRVGFVYGDERVEADGADQTSTLVSQGSGETVRRDLAEERRWTSALQVVLPLRRLSLDAALTFLREQVAPLIEAGWEIVGREDLRYFRLSTATPSIRLSIVSGADWFDVHNEVILGAEKVEWPALKAAMRSGSRHVRLGNGEWAPLPEAWLAARQRLREKFGADKAEEEDGALRVACFEAPTLSALVDDTNDAQVDDGWLDFRARIDSFGGVAPVPVPATFQGTLRPYQQQGLDYLAFLRDHGLHGILADDMGLGKTVQAAALLAANHPNAVGPSLIIAPTSVVANWEAELKRFVPTLRVLVLHGAKRDVGAIAQHDVIITSYATARQDLTAHRAQTYHTLLLDEAQAIKNARSQTARTMRQLPALHRLCLTGTPIENDTQDLWSIFAFLMPGLLGPVDAFRTQFATPIAMGERGPREALKARVAPFILRRLKAQVAPDLPPRTDITVVCELEPAQRRVYDALLSDVRNGIQQKLQRDGLERSRLSILAALLKLRQVCCHPSLIGTPETLHLGSGKLEAAIELIQELIAGGHRALLFSQFTSMLAILRERLDQLGIPYAYLDGSTRDRQARVDAFNAGDTPIFLISLKAGGSGLNLTGADYVIHYDPWWNPASEDQATDRAHRIGQTRQVFNYKLVAKDTIEEKLVVLQAEKRGLVRDLLATDAGGKMLTEETVAALFG